jgi:hypothetical protein
MAYPFAQMPTLKSFIDAAVNEGCREGISQKPIVTSRGAAHARYLVGRNGVPYILPDIGDEDRLTPTVLASMIRVLQINAYRDLCAHLV